ncbi:uridine diphosphate-N-acetylglucosamine-binding protein YvcK [Idiomarina xiamenensis]|uniref:Putative gluconeogenesis factor n=1 Tax=Idiomarina xiamenensis 10-D-4 TaxID=740709 RepID=K2L4I8_9GAMM|nr:uridine diphosphate-N-acetylglucosamine-binding protein YvcK [Idiomarina xiamenensis]EKE84730.1 hypothetical protein A10D4_03930 [Idiomarina xiamenensis 10-D-4]
MQLNNLSRVTAIGGGHGLGRLLSTLSFLKRRLIGVVATTDNGGATGLLRQSHHCIAWGDIRNCLSQLAQQPLAAEVLNFRFAGETTLSGHNLGNLLLYTLDQLSARPLDGIQLLSRLLNIDTRILPMSEAPTDLVADTQDGLSCFGEIHVDQLAHMPSRLRLDNDIAATPEAVRHIMHSDLIILGPGSLLTSVMPPLLVGDIRRAVADSQAKVIFIDNLVAERSPAGQLTLAQKLNWMQQQWQYPLVDLVISNEQLGTANQWQLPVVGDVSCEPSMPHRHQQQSLLEALERAVNLLFSSASRVN